jgi:hypothetical protein
LSFSLFYTATGRRRFPVKAGALNDIKCRFGGPLDSSSRALSALQQLRRPNVRDFTIFAKRYR